VDVPGLAVQVRPEADVHLAGLRQLAHDVRGSLAADGVLDDQCSARAITPPGGTASHAGQVTGST
jgi:hypothetical protein